MEHKVKITHVTRYAKPHKGGIEAVINQINESLNNEEFEKEVLCISNTDSSSFENGVKYTRCKYKFEIVTNPISFDFLRRLSKVDTDIIQYHMPFIFGAIAHFLAKPKYKKMYITYHSDIAGYDKAMKPFWGIYRKFLAKSDKIHVLSPNLIESSKVLNPFKEKCIVIPQGISLENEFNAQKVQEIKSKYPDKKILFSLGRLVKYKGFIYGIEAMKDIENAVYLIGGTGPLKETLEEYIQNNNLKDKVILLGKISDEDLNNYYAACDIYLFPSCMRSEAFGIVQLEAMKYSKPVINTNLGTGVNYVSIDGETGLTVEPENSKQLADAINTLIQNDELRLKYGQNARKRVERLFDIKKINNCYKQFYMENNE